MSFFKTVDSKVLFNQDGELIYFIPEKYFDLNVAFPIGEVIELMGMFTYGLYDSKGKQIKLGRFKAPTMFQCKPSSITKESNFHLTGTKTPAAYRFLHFKKDDELICNVNIPKDITNVEKFVNLMNSAHLPEDIPYNEIHEYIIKNAELNKFDYKVSNQIIGIVISELYRSSRDLTKPFRLAVNQDKPNYLDYTAVSIKKIPKYTSAYTAITSENADEAIAAALTTKGNTESPLEKVVMGS